MAVPWLRILDAVIGITDFALLRKVTRPPELSADRGGLPDEVGVRSLGSLEARLASVVVAALKEAFDRDNRRLDLERERVEAERLRAERALRLEMRRQMIDREIGRLRLMAGLAVTSWLGVMFSWAWVFGAAGIATRVALGAGWVLLLASLAITLGQMGVLSRSAPDDLDREPFVSGTPGTLAAWVLVAGLTVVGIAAIFA